MNEPQSFTNAKHGHLEKNGRHNGPHLESKWAMNLLGTNLTASERKRQIQNKNSSFNKSCYCSAFYNPA